MLSKNKKGLELSINFIVMLIIVMVVFGFGITFIGKFFTGAQTLKENLDVNTQKRIESLLNTGEQIAIPINSKELGVGGSSVFGVGILNILGETKDFTINIDCTTALGKAGSQVDISSCQPPKENGWTFKNEVTESIKNNEQKVVSLLFQVPKGTEPGTYIFTITVKYEDENNVEKTYDVPRKIYMKVK